MRRVSFVLNRVTATTLVVLAAGQAALAGSFLDGNYDMIKVHMFGAVAMLAVSLVQLVVVIFARRAGAPRSILAPGIAMPFVIALQAFLGGSRILSVHVLLGTLLVFGLAQGARMAWSRPLRPVPTDPGTRAAAGSGAGAVAGEAA